MPEAPDRTIAALTIPTHASRRSSALRAILGAVFALSVLAVPQAVNPTPVAAGSSCTGWTSTTKPPRSIRVLNRRLNKVETVAFRKYVKKVMASGEWPSRLKMATLEAGALATKQYAWYYAMKGNHRSHYVYKGRCYDVRDDTTDQLYKHYATPDARQKKAVDKTWGLSLRKSGRFFLTGYRAGSSRTCGADANGWKLFAASVEACARKGWSYKRILNTYLNPNLKYVWSDAVGPNVSRPRIVFKKGNSVATGAATVAWQPRPRKTDVGRFQLQRKVSGGTWKTVELPKPKVWKTDAWVKLNGKSRFRVRAKDSKGNWGPWSYSPKRRTIVRGPEGRTLAGGYASAVATPTKVKARFTGRSVALVMRTGPDMGRVKVFINGKSQGIFSLDRAKSTHRRLVFARNWSRSAERSIAVKPVSGDARVDFQGFLVLR
ncbi:MAG: SpoIID/LytB domain-containing protein [Candidatus Limnocylindrales bacterium]